MEFLPQPIFELLTKIWKLIWEIFMLEPANQFERNFYEMLDIEYYIIYYQPNLIFL